MKVLLTGATGFVGSEIAHQLHAAGHEVQALVRQPQAPAAEELSSRYSVRLHAGDILAPESLTKPMAGMDAVVHLVGIISEVGRCTFENIHTVGTQNVVAVARQAGVRRFVHMSALGTRRNAVSRYHQSKWTAEEVVRQSSFEHAIFRPSLIYGPRDHFVNLFARIIRLSPMVPIMGSAHSQFQPVAVEMVARAFVQSLTQPEASGQTYDLCGPDTLTMEGIIDHILAVMKRRRWKVTIPTGLARLQASFLEFVFPLLLRKAPPLNRDQLLMLAEDNVGNAQAANQLFDLQHPGFREGIDRYLGVSPRYSHRVAADVKRR